MSRSARTNRPRAGRPVAAGVRTLDAGPRPIRLLTSFPRPRSTTNPYIVQLAEALDAQTGVDVSYFSWGAALRGGHDVVHLHWPETWLQGRTLPRRVARLLLTTVLCLRWWLTGTALVRTTHNLERPQGLWRVDYAVLAVLDRLTRVRVRLNPRTDQAPGIAHVTIPHGHYRDWFARFPQRASEPGHLVFAGRIRRYKGVEHLLETFARTQGPGLRLTVAGLPSSTDLVTEVQALASRDTRVGLRLEYVDEPALVEVVSSAALVVLPYRHMHNSGTVLAALSLDRPVLVPDNDVNRALREEVGQGWVHLYAGDLGPGDLRAALDAVETLVGSPDLSARGWDHAGAEHLAAYRLAVAGPGLRT